METNYKIEILKRAQKELSAFRGGFFEQIVDTIASLANNPRPSGCKKLTGREGWRLRVGDYRIIYEIKDSNRLVTILHVGHRKDVYR